MRARVSAALLGLTLTLVLGPFAGLFATPAAASHVGWGLPTIVAGDDLGWDPQPGPQVAVDDDGNAIAVWPMFDGTRWNIRAARFVPGIGWGPPAFVETGLEDARSPAIAVDAAGNAIVAWNYVNVNNGELIPPDEELRYSLWANRYDVGRGWGAPTQIDTGAGNSFVSSWSNSLDVSSSGRGVIAWREGTRIWAASFSPGSGWSAPVPGPLGSEVEDVAVDETGSAFVIWTERPGAWEGYGRMVSLFVPGSGWEGATLLDDGISYLDTRIALTPSGGAVAVYPDWDDEVESGIWLKRFTPESGWETATRVTTVRRSPGQYVYAPSVVTDRSGNIFVTWSQVGPQQSGWVSRFVPGLGWDTPTLVAANTTWTPRIAMDPHGNGFLTWMEEGATMRVRVNRFVPSMGWGEATTIAEFPLTAGRYQPAAFRVYGTMDPNGNAVAVWSQPDGIWANRYGEVVSGDIQHGLDATNSNLASLEAKIVLLLAVQIALVASTAVLLVLYLNLRGRRPMTGRAPPEGIGPLQPPAPRGSESNGGTTPRAQGYPIHRTSTRPSVRWSEADGPLRLTAKERILLHLSDFAKYADSAEVPPELTQGGIAEEAGVDLQHFAQYVRPLLREGLVRQRSARVKGGLQRRKVYVLADGGRQSALAIRERVRSAVVRFRDDGVVRDATVAEVVSAARGSLSILEAVRDSISQGVVDLEAHVKTRVR